MDDQFAKLEARVLDAVALIQRLRGDNSRLQERSLALEGQVQELAAAQSLLQQELAQARATADQINKFEEKRRILEERVGGLLDKLEAIG